MVPAQPLSRTALRPGETLDAICGGKVRLLQRARGYRFNLDAVLLAHFAAEQGARGPIIDLGTGCGIIPLILARKFGRRTLFGLELQPSLFGLAARNVELNGCERRISVALGDLRRAARHYERGAFSHVIANPPYRAVEAGRVSPDEEKAIARHEVRCKIAELARAAAHLLRPGGGLHLVFPAARLVELFGALRGQRLEPRRLRLVHPLEERPAKLALILATRDGGTGLEVLPPLVAHPVGGKGFTTEVRAMLAWGPAGRGGAAATGGVDRSRGGAPVLR
jgi:tRNA1Val (adenine37-N6)-methyltransferase